MTTATIDTLPIAEIKIGNRFRKDLGDIDPLATSMQELGLLHPVVITGDGELIAGARRLEAAKMLGWEDVPVRVAESIVGVTQLLIAERDENTCRQDMKRSEQVALGLELEKLIQPIAEERKLANLELGRGNSPAPAIDKFAQRGETRDIVGAAVGMSGHTWQEAKAIVTDTQSEDPEIRAVALEALEQMDRTGKVHPNYQKVQRAKVREPEPGEFAAWDKNSQRYKDKCAKIVKALWDSLNRFDVAAPGLAEVDMEVLVDNLSDAEFESAHEMAANAIKSLKTFQRKLRDHKPTKGAE